MLLLRLRVTPRLSVENVFVFQLPCCAVYGNVTPTDFFNPILPALTRQIVPISFPLPNSFLNKQLDGFLCKHSARMISEGLNCFATKLAATAQGCKAHGTYSCTVLARCAPLTGLTLPELVQVLNMVVHNSNSYKLYHYSKVITVLYCTGSMDFCKISDMWLILWPLTRPDGRLNLLNFITVGLTRPHFLLLDTPSPRRRRPRCHIQITVRKGGNKLWSPWMARSPSSNSTERSSTHDTANCRLQAYPSELQAQLGHCSSRA